MIIQGFKQLARFAIHHPKWVLLLAAIVTLSVAPGVFHLKLRTDGHTLVSATAPEVVTDAEIRSHFGIHDQMVVLIRPGGTNDIFNAATLQVVRDLTAAFKSLPGVSVADVMSLATEPSFRLRPGTINHQLMLEPPLESPAKLAQLRDDVRRIELYTGTLVAMDGRSTVILVGVPEGADRGQFHAEILQIIAKEKTATDEISVTGAPVAESLFGTQILQDLGVPVAWLGDAPRAVAGAAGMKMPASLHELRVFIAQQIGLVPLAALVMMLVLLVCFRNLLAALLPLPGVAATMLFVFGLMGWLGVPVYLTTAVMPVLLIVISVTNDIYLFSRYFTLLRERPDANHVVLVEETFDRLARPVACTSFAAVVGFLSFGFSPLGPVQAFGWCTAVGAVFGLLLSFTVVPALLALANPNWLRPRKKPARPSASALAAGFGRLGEFVLRPRSPVIGLAVIIMALTPLGLRFLKVQDSWTNGFDPESEFRRTTEFVNRNFFGMHRLFVCADAPKIIHGEITAASLNGPDLALPAEMIGDPMSIAGSPITLSAGDSAVWRTHVEMVNQSGDSVFARLANHEDGTNFTGALAKTGHGQYDVNIRTQFQPDLIRELGNLGAFIREHQRPKLGAVGGVLGPADYLATTRFMARPDDPTGRVLPDNAAETKLMWDYYALALGRERLHELVDTNYWRSLTTVFLKDANFAGTKKLMNDVRRYEQSHLKPLRASLSFAGDVAVSQSLVRGIVSTQLQSLGWSLLGIFVVTAALGGSWRWGCYCLLPSLMAVVIKFAVMGAADIPLGVATSMFAAMTLGIGVNCAIHLLEGFDRARAAGQTRPGAVNRALRLTGPPALINTLAISLGFGVLMLSQVPANVRLGILLGLGLVNCFVVSVLLLPALLCWRAK